MPKQLRIIRMEIEVNGRSMVVSRLSDRRIYVEQPLTPYIPKEHKELVAKLFRAAELWSRGAK